MRAGITYTTQSGESVEVEALVPDFVKWERLSGRSTADLAREIRLEDLAQLAWAAASRSQLTALDFEQFLDQLAEIELGSLESPKATRPARSGARSSSSS